jgi:hypothetical protein
MIFLHAIAPQRTIEGHRLFPSRALATKLAGGVKYKRAVEQLPLSGIQWEYRDIPILCALTKKRKTTKNLIGPTNRRLKGLRTQKKEL